MTWTIAKVKAELPAVKVKVGKNNFVWARVSGRLNQHATVTVDNDKPRAGTPNWYDFHVAWQTLADCLNNDKPVTI